jgi:ABC-type multidrug transport system fused ATPase/permease subunit
MSEGKIVEQGSHHELSARHGVYAQMVERELKEEIFENAS